MRLSLQTFEGSALFTVTVAAAFKTESRKGRKRDSTTKIHARNGMNLALTFTTLTGDITEAGLCSKKGIH